MRSTISSCPACSRPVSKSANTSAARHEGGGVLATTACLQLRSAPPIELLDQFRPAVLKLRPHLDLDQDAAGPGYEVLRAVAVRLRFGDVVGSASQDLPFGLLPQTRNRGVDVPLGGEHRPTPTDVLHAGQRHPRMADKLVADGGHTLQSLPDVELPARLLGQ